jgi:hypothetical protein
MGEVVESHLIFLANPLGVRTAYRLFNAAIGIAVLPASLIAGLLWRGGALMAFLTGLLFARLIK